jgi:uncharacterized protein (DUF2344 family)
MEKSQKVLKESINKVEEILKTAEVLLDYTDKDAEILKMRKDFYFRGRMRLSIIFTMCF